MASAIDDSGVRAILLDIDSPGGETAGCFDLVDYIYSVRGIKPVYAVANDIALSAAYAIASSASRIFLNRTGAVGSIGVYALHVDQSGFDETIGAKYSYVFAGAKKVDGNAHEPLSDRARADIQDEVDREYGIFTETVARNRKASVKDIVATQASVVWAENALPLLADQVGTFDEAMGALQQSLGSARLTTTAARAATLTKGAAMPELEIEAAAAKKGDDPEEKKKKPGKDDAKESDAKGPAKDDEDDDDGDQPGNEGKSKAAGVALIAGEPLQGMRTESDIQAISALCKMAGHPEQAAEFLMQKNSKGRYLSVAEVSEALTSSRVAESEKQMISSHVNPNAGAGGVQELEAQAVSLARQNRSSASAGLYVSGATTRVTKERAYAAMLEEHPEAYEAYRNQHNAAAMVRTLQNAGYQIAPR